MTHDKRNDGITFLGRHPYIAGSLLAVITVVVLFVILEGSFRLVRYAVRGPEPTLTVDDPALGWVLNTRRQKVTRTNSCGEEVVTLPPPHPLIVRYPRAERGINVLFLGDSSTHAHEVSTGAAYYGCV